MSKKQLRTDERAKPLAGTGTIWYPVRALLVLVAMVVSFVSQPVLSAFADTTPSETTASPDPSATPTEDPSPAPSEEPAPAPTETSTPAPEPTSTGTPAPEPTQEPAPAETAGAESAVPTIASHKDDYIPGEGVVLLGEGWHPDEAIHLFVNDDEGRTWAYRADVTAAQDGTLLHEFLLPDWFVARYSVTASGELSGTATTTFTDSITGGTSQTNENGGGGGNASNSLTILKPTPLSIGDFMLAQITFTHGTDIANLETPAPTGGTGWILIRRDDRLTDLGQAIFYKVANSADTAAGTMSYRWRFRNSSNTLQAERAAGGITRYVGVDTANPIVGSTGAFGDSTSLTALSVTGAANAMLVGLFGIMKLTTLSDPTDMSERYFKQHGNSSGPTVKSAEQVTSANPTGDRTSTAGQPEKWVAQLVTLREAAAANTPPTATVSITPTNPTTNQTLTATATKADADGNAVSLTFVWKVNGTTKRTFSSATALTDTFDLSVAGNGNKNDTIRVEVTPNDGTVNGAVAIDTEVVANSAPTATVNITPENPTTNQTLTANVTTADADGDVVTVSYSWKKNGVTTPFTSSTYNLALGGNGDAGDTITVEVTPNDGTVNGAVATDSEVVANSAPTAVNVSDSTNEDTPKTITLTGNDVDNSSLTFSIIPLAGPSNGTLGSISTPTCGGGTCTATIQYTPNANFNGLDTFKYKVNDGSLDSNQATVTITVAAVNDPPTASNVSDSTNEDTAKTVTLSGNDVEGSALTFSIISLTGPSNGTLGSISTPTCGGGTCTATVQYTPSANFNGLDSFKYKVNDGSLDSNQATVTITVNPVNDPPDAVNDSATVAEDSGANAINVLANDSFAPDTGETLIVTAKTNGANGAVVITGDGTGLTYAPNANFFGSDSFTYAISDGNGGTDTATVSVTVTNVNDPPNAADDLATVAEDSSGNVINVLANDSFAPDAGETLRVLAVGAATNGTVTLDDNGTPTDVSDDKVLYTPNANFFGSDAFGYTVGDGNGGTDTATVNVTVTNVNDDPVANDDSATVAEDSGANAIDVLANDNDGPDSGETLTVTIVTQGTNGSVAITGGGTGLTYTPAANFFGSDSFTYTISDGNGGTDTTTVTITVTEVNDAPVADDETATVTEDSGATAIDVLTGDSTGPANESSQILTVTAVTQGSDGSVAITGGGTGVSYTPNGNFNGSDSFTYTVTDNGTTNGVADHKSDTATVTITVTEVNDAPTAATDSKSTAEDTQLTFPASDLTANDSTGPANESGQILTVASVTGGANTHGTVSLNSGTITYTPDGDFNGSASFTYQVCDNGTTNGSLDSKCDTGTVNVSVSEVNDAPVADDETATVAEDSGATAIDVLTGDSTGPANESGQTLTVTAVTQGSDGSVAITGGGTGVSYTPNGNFNGSDSFTYTVTDNGTTNGAADPKTATGTVNLTVTEVNDAPTANADSKTTAEDTPLTFAASTLTTNDAKGPANESGQTLTVTSVTGGANTHGTVQLNAGNVTYTPDANYFGPASFDYQVCDNGTTNGAADPLCATGTVNVTVTAVNDAPVLTLSASSVTAQYSDSISTVTITGTDIDSSSLTVSLGSALPADLVLSTPLTKTVDANGSATWTITGRLNVAAGSYVRAITVSDGALTDSKNLTINVTKEDASIRDIMPTDLQVDETDGDKDSLTVTFFVDESAGELSGTLASGNGLKNAQTLTVKLTPVTTGSSYTCTVNAAQLTTIDGDTVQGACNLANVLTNVYQVDVTMNSNYFTAPMQTSVIDVIDPGAGFVTGGGWFWFHDPTTNTDVKTNFGFNAKRLKSGQIQGSVLLVFHYPDGNRIVKSNATGTLSVGQNAAGKWVASLTNWKATYQVPSGTLWCGTNKCGGYTFNLYVEDLGEPGSGVDKFWIEVKDPNGALVAKVSMPRDGSGASLPLIINQGNIQVPHTTGGKR